jgi:hypothetical protein
VLPPIAPLTRNRIVEAEVVARNDGIWFSAVATSGIASCCMRSAPTTLTGVGEL